MEEKNYNLNMDYESASQDFSLDDILNEYRSTPSAAEYVPSKESAPSERIVLEESGSGEVRSSVSSVEELMESNISAEEAKAENPLSEMEIRALVDSDEKELYASAEVDYEMGKRSSPGKKPPG